jgi:hypothetical protein
MLLLGLLYFQSKLMHTYILRPFVLPEPTYAHIYFNPLPSGTLAAYFLTAVG